MSAAGLSGRGRLLPSLWPELEASRAEMTFPGILGADPSGPAGREEGSAQGQSHLPAAGSEAGRLENGVRPSTTVNSPGGGGHTRAWNCPRLLVPSSEEGPEWLRELAAPRPFQQLEEEACSLPPPCSTPHPQEPKSCQRSGCRRGWGTCRGPGRQCQGWQGRQDDSHFGKMALRPMESVPWVAMLASSRLQTPPLQEPETDRATPSPRAPCPLPCQERTQTAETVFEGWPQQLSPVPGWPQSSHGTHRTSPRPLS